MSPIRVVVADDHVYATEGLGNIISQASDMELVGKAMRLFEVVPLVTEKEPDVVVLDIAWLGDKTAGIHMIPEIRAASPQVEVIAISVYPEVLDQAQEKGAVLVLSKGFSKTELQDAIRWAAKRHGEPTATPVSKEFDRLTTRECEVLRLLAQGKPDKEIAAELDISITTAKKHVSTILGKLRVENRTEAAVIAERYRLC